MSEKHNVKIADDKHAEAIHKALVLLEETIPGVYFTLNWESGKIVPIIVLSGVKVEAMNERG